MSDNAVGAFGDGGLVHAGRLIVVAGLGSEMRGSATGLAKSLGAACLSGARIGRKTAGGQHREMPLPSVAASLAGSGFERSSPRGTMGQMTCRAAIHRREGKYQFERNPWRCRRALLGHEGICEWPCQALAGRPSGCSMRRYPDHRLLPASQGPDQAEFPAGNNGRDDLSCRCPPARGEVSVRKEPFGVVVRLGSDMKGSAIGVAKALGAVCLSRARIGRKIVGTQHQEVP
ncbi:hypothetical protein AF71_00007390 [Rhizobium sp. 57MFTsu3.2]|nr:hypothetical protein [Rhizobium sp. 57MFTsu3.2]